MFDFLTDSIDNALDVATKLGTMDWDRIERRQLAQLIADGVTIVAISEASGIAVDVLEDMLDD